MEISMEVPLKTKDRSTLWFCLPVLGKYLKECKSTYSQDILTLMFIAAEFTMDKIWNWPRCPSTDEWIKKMYIYMMEYYSAIKKS
jgi:hypothetical protein